MSDHNVDELYAENRVLCARVDALEATTLQLREDSVRAAELLAEQAKLLDRAVRTLARMP